MRVLAYFLLAISGPAAWWVLIQVADALELWTRKARWSLPAKPVTMSAAKRMAKEFAEEHAKGSLLGSVFAGLLVKIITAFIEQLLKNHDIIPKESA